MIGVHLFPEKNFKFSESKSIEVFSEILFPKCSGVTVHLLCCFFSSALKRIITISPDVKNYQTVTVV